MFGSTRFVCIPIHGNENMFKKVKGHILENKNIGVGTLAWFYNVYAGSEKWENANQVREKMKGIGMKKMAGCSWIKPDTSSNRS